MADPAIIELVRRFEPILCFHPQERFFPSDAKRYVEHCALWKAVRDEFDEKNSWGGEDPPKGKPFPRNPMIENGTIVAVESEERPGDTFLGEKQGSVFNFLITNKDEERFLELTPGWDQQPPDDRGVTKTSVNQLAALFLLEGRYRADPLADSRFWYHAEVFDTERLQELTSHQTPRGMDLGPTFRELKNPALICYYLFFPGHDEGLEGCENTESGPTFGSFAGEWACLAVLLEREDPAQQYQATRIGLTSRNVGKIEFLDEERRIGMSLFDFGADEVRKQEDDHVQLFVARGTHGLYTKPGVHELSPFTKNDLSRGSCGAAEGLAESLEPGPPTDSDVDLEDLLPSAKIIGGLLLGFFGLPGFIAGSLWLQLEVGNPPKRRLLESPEPSEQQLDHAPEEGDFGFVVHPEGVIPPDAPPDPSRNKIWPATDPNNPNSLSKTINGRTYSLLVDRDDPDTAPILFPVEGSGGPGYMGRWGPRVEVDPNTRRAGMRFPEFWRMYFEELTKLFFK